MLLLRGVYVATLCSIWPAAIHCFCWAMRLASDARRDSWWLALCSTHGWPFARSRHGCGQHCRVFEIIKFDQIHMKSNYQSNQIKSNQIKSIQIKWIYNSIHNSIQITIQFESQFNLMETLSQIFISQWNAKFCDSCNEPHKSFFKLNLKRSLFWTNESSIDFDAMLQSEQQLLETLSQSTTLVFVRVNTFGRI